MPRRTKTSGPGIYVYDPEQDRPRSEDALGNVTEESNGRTYVTGFQSVRIETEDGNELEIKFDPNTDGVEIRNNGRTSLRSSLAAIPHSSNVLKVVAYDY